MAHFSASGDSIASLITVRIGFEPCNNKKSCSFAGSGYFSCFCGKMLCFLPGVLLSRLSVF